MAIDLFSGELTLLHNPRCSKSRSAKALLEERGASFREHRYLEEPLSREELGTLAGLLDKSPSKWVRNKEDAYKEAGLTAEATDDTLLNAMAAHPTLVERPILISSDRAVVGRPPELILELLD